MLCSASASAIRLLFFKRNLNFAFVSACSSSSSFLLTKHLSTGFENTLLVSSQNKLLPLLSRLIIKTRVSRPVLLSSSRADHTMASNSKTGSVYDFTVKVSFLDMFDFVIVYLIIRRKQKTLFLDEERLKGNDRWMMMILVSVP